MFHKVASFHSLILTFIHHTSHYPVHRFSSWHTQTTSSSHPHTQVRVQPRNSYNPTNIRILPGQNKKTHTKSRHSNLHSVHAGPCRIYEQSGPNNKLQYTTHGNAPKGRGSYLRSKTHIQHTHSQHLSTRSQTSTNHKKHSLQQDRVNRRRHSWDTYKTCMRPALEYSSSIWSPLASSTSVNKLQGMQNAPLRPATGFTQDINIQHQHDETLTLIIHEHLQLHASQYIQKTQHPSHPIHKHTTYFNTPRLKKHYF